MHSTLGRSLLAVTVVLSTVTLAAVLLVSRTETQAKAGPPETPSPTAVELAHDQLKNGQVWDGATTTLAEIRSLPASAEAIDKALPLMQLLAFTMSSLMVDEEVQAFVKQLDPVLYPADNLALMCFYHEFRAWEVGRKMSFITEEDFWTLVDGLTQHENALVRMAALLYKSYQKRNMATSEGRSAAVDLINRMADECSECRVTREMFRVLLREAMWRTTEDSDAVAEDVYPEAIAGLLLNAPWNAQTTALIAEDPVVKTVFSIFNSAEVGGAKSKREALGALVAEAVRACEDHEDPEVRSWLRGTLSPCIAAGKSFSSHGEAVRSAMAGLASRAREDGGGPRSKTPLDASRAQYILFIKSFRLPEGAVDTVNMESLLEQRRQQEPVEINYFARIPGEVSYFAHTLISAGDYDGAAQVLKRLCDAYPGSDLARRSQNTIDFLASIGKTSGSDRI